MNSYWLCKILKPGSELEHKVILPSVKAAYTGQYLPTSLVTSHRPLRIVFTVTEVRHQVVKSHYGSATKHSVIASDLQLREHITHDPGDRAQVGHGHNATINRAGLLLGEPLGDAGIAEGVLTVRSLYRRESTQQANQGMGQPGQLTLQA